MCLGEKKTTVEEVGEKDVSIKFGGFCLLHPVGHQVSLKAGPEAPSLTSINLNYTCMQNVKRCSVSMCLAM